MAKATRCGRLALPLQERNCREYEAFAQIFGYPAHRTFDRTAHATARGLPEIWQPAQGEYDKSPVCLQTTGRRPQLPSPPNRASLYLYFHNDVGRTVLGEKSADVGVNHPRFFYSEGTGQGSSS